MDPCCCTGRKLTFLLFPLGEPAPFDGTTGAGVEAAETTRAMAVAPCGVAVGAGNVVCRTFGGTQAACIATVMHPEISVGEQQRLEEGT